MKEDEMMTFAGSAEDRNVRRKHSEIGEIQSSDDTEHTKKGDRQCLKKIRRRSGKLIAEISNEKDGKYGKGDEANK